jgi:hypothetical protein
MSNHTCSCCHEYDDAYIVQWLNSDDYKIFLLPEHTHQYFGDKNAQIRYVRSCVKSEGYAEAVKSSAKVVKNALALESKSESDIVYTYDVAWFKEDKVNYKSTSHKVLSFLKPEHTRFAFETDWESDYVKVYYNRVKQHSDIHKKAIKNSAINEKSQDGVSSSIGVPSS